MKNSILLSVWILSALISAPTMAANLEVQISKDKPYSIVNHGNEMVKVQRIQDTSHVIDGSFANAASGQSRVGCG